MRRYLPNLILPLLLMSLTEIGYGKWPDHEVVLDMDKVVSMRPAQPEDTYKPRARTVIRLQGDYNAHEHYVAEDLESIKRLLPTTSKVSPPAAN